MQCIKFWDYEDQQELVPATKIDVNSYKREHKKSDFKNML